MSNGGDIVPLDVPTVWRGERPSLDDDRDLLEGVATKRILAYIVDVVVISILLTIASVAAGIVGIISLGLLLGPLTLLLALVPLAYHTFLLGGAKSATLGMRMMGIELRTWDGYRPGYLQAALQTIVFYISIGLTTWLILLVVFFNDHRRTLHDLLCGTVVINTPDHPPGALST